MNYHKVVMCVTYCLVIKNHLLECHKVGESQQHLEYFAIEMFPSRSESQTLATEIRSALGYKFSQNHVT